ncbi:MAG: TSUP family transporter [Propionibacteriales bacterium]|nr:TSUP family transporter [Propionibacteriales bacterium]
MLTSIGNAIDADVFLALVLVSAVTGLVRGFSGFGSAMIFVPVASALTSPQTAVVLFLLTDGLMSMPMVVPASRLCAWREVLPLALGAVLTVPLGVWLLVVVDPVIIRWIISSLILMLITLLALGLRWRRQPRLPATAAVGGGAGLTGGMTGLAGPPVIIFWMAAQNDAARLRANIIVFFGMTGVFNAAAYSVAGIMTAERIARAVALIPVYGLTLLLGAWLFRFASERFFRWLAYALCVFAALSTLPLADGLI